MNQVKTFSHPLFGQVRTMVMTDGQIGFVGKDVAVALGYQNPSNAINIHVDNEDKTTYLIQVSGSNYKTKTTFINESGLYALVLSSRLPQAREFKHWVTAEVLPQIRRTGGYIPVGKDDNQDDVLRRAIAIYDKTVGIKDEIIGAQKAIIGKQTEVINKQMTTIGNLNGQLEEAQPKADYCDQVLASPSTFTMTEVAKDCSMTVHQLTQLLISRSCSCACASSTDRPPAHTCSTPVTSIRVMRAIAPAVVRISSATSLGLTTTSSGRRKDGDLFMNLLMTLIRIDYEKKLYVLHGHQNHAPTRRTPEDGTMLPRHPHDGQRLPLPLCRDGAHPAHPAQPQNLRRTTHHRHPAEGRFAAVQLQACATFRGAHRQ